MHLWEMRWGVGGDGTPPMVEAEGEGLVPYIPERAALDRGLPGQREEKKITTHLLCARTSRLFLCRPPVFSSRRHMLSCSPIFNIMSKMAQLVKGFQTRGHRSSVWVRKGFCLWEMAMGLCF